jgi:cytochrome c oxidase subunit 1
MFANVPVVTSRDGLWAQRDERLVMTGLDPARRMILVTSIHDAEPESLHEHPTDSIWPLVMALGVGAAFIAAVYTPWGLFPGTAVALIGALGWAWPQLHTPEKVDLHR